MHGRLIVKSDFYAHTKEIIAVFTQCLTSLGGYFDTQIVVRRGERFGRQREILLFSI